MTEPIHILSLGAGVQSSTLALMAAAGEVEPMPIAAIFADTQHEPASVSTVKTVECNFAHLKTKLSLGHVSLLRCYAAKFQAFCGRPELSERVVERRLIFKQPATL